MSDLSTTSFLADAPNTLSFTKPSLKLLLAVITHEGTLRSCKNGPVHWQHYGHVEAQTKDLEVTETDSQVKHSLGCVLPGLQDIAPNNLFLHYFLVCKQSSASALIYLQKEAAPHIKFHFNCTDEMCRVTLASCTLLH